MLKTLLSITAILIAATPAIWLALQAENGSDPDKNTLQQSITR